MSSDYPLGFMSHTKLIKRHMAMTDNTNADIETRAHWIRVAKEFNVPIRCVRFTASTRLAEHNDVVRALNPGTVRIPTPFFLSIIHSRLSMELGKP